MILNSMLRYLRDVIEFVRSFELEIVVGDFAGAYKGAWVGGSSWKHSRLVWNVISC